MPQAMTFPDARAAVDKEWEKLEGLPAWQLTKVKSFKEVSLEAQRGQRTVHFATSVTSKKAKVEPKYQKYKRPGCAPK